ncbi:MAG: BON domain-containing protein [Acidobacteriota bacterium]|nr:BON domain-containing protein [Acidobacteriota bacterium]
MKRMFAVFCFVLALSAVAFAQAQPAQGGEMTKKSDKKAEKKAEKAKPQGDGDIQKCIADKFASSEKLKTQDFHATVVGGEATLTGNAANAGSKGAATRIAKSCGATKVANNITAPAVKKSAKSEKSEKKG